MPDYEALYHLLFNAITDALEDIAGAITPSPGRGWRRPSARPRKCT